MLVIVSNWRRIARALPVAAFAAVLSVSPALAQQQTLTLTVVLTELQFNPKTITLTVGQPVQLNIQNKGLADHNLASRDSADSLPVSNVTYQKADNDPRQLQSYEPSDTKRIIAPRLADLSMFPGPRYVESSPTKRGAGRLVGVADATSRLRRYFSR